MSQNESKIKQTDVEGVDNIYKQQFMKLRRISLKHNHKIKQLRLNAEKEKIENVPKQGNYKRYIDFYSDKFEIKPTPFSFDSVLENVLKTKKTGKKKQFLRLRRADSNIKLSRSSIPKIIDAAVEVNYNLAKTKFSSSFGVEWFNEVKTKLHDEAAEILRITDMNMIESH